MAEVRGAGRSSVNYGTSAIFILTLFLKWVEIVRCLTNDTYAFQVDQATIDYRKWVKETFPLKEEAGGDLGRETGVGPSHTD